MLNFPNLANDPKEYKPQGIYQDLSQKNFYKLKKNENLESKREMTPYLQGKTV